MIVDYIKFYFIDFTDVNQISNLNLVYQTKQEKKYHQTCKNHRK